MVKKLSTIMLIVSILFLNTACSVAKSPEELIKRPHKYFNGEDINKITSTFLTNGRVLTLAQSQMGENAVRMLDIDADGMYEIMLLYKKENEVNEYGVIILKKKKGVWYEINNIAVKCFGLDLVKYEDITGDGKLDIFIGMQKREDKYKKLNVYSYHGGYFHFIENISYEKLNINDIDNDGIPELGICRNLQYNNLSNECSKKQEYFWYRWDSVNELEPILERR
ncbi:FG-GAP repeat domain-containing protein [Clostridium tepidiprofundi]|nr:VCBS repeat-containing protein [Clostridium tepidiprofundi]